MVRNMLEYITAVANGFQYCRKSHKRLTSKWLRGKGIEIGPFKTPIEGICPYYVDKFREFAGERCLVDVCSDPGELPFKTDSFDYVASSHVFEHIANPIAAICEWYRVLRPGGIIYMVVPDRRFTWDRSRNLTSCEHMFEDYRKGTTDCDVVHIEDFVDNIDWSEFDPSTAPKDVPDRKQKLRKTYHDAVKAGRIINIHFHVFEPCNVLELFTKLTTDPLTGLKLSIENYEERFPADSPNGFLIVARSQK